MDVDTCVGPSERDLFGGALSAIFPAGLKDVSDMREIPDNQEVFAHDSSDQSVIVEILEYVEEPDDMAIRTHFDDVASSNCADNNQDSELQHTEEIDKSNTNMPDCDKIFYILGQQRVAKFKETSKNVIQVHMGLFRLPQFTTDILVTFNDPININPDSSSHKPVPVSASKWTEEEFKTIIKSLKINDPDIFGS